MRLVVLVALAVATIKPRSKAAADAAAGADGAAAPGSAVDVRAHGATGDGRTDDTAAVQRAIDAAHAAGGGTVLFPPGTYVVTSVGIRPGIRYSGYGAVIKRPANQARDVRTFNTAKAGYSYSGDHDSTPLTIEGFVFDGSRAEQGKHDAYELEQAHLLFLVADPAKPGRLRARVRDCHFKDGVADAISVYTNVDVRVSDCSATDCFRGGLVVTGGHTRVQVSNFSAGGKTHATGIDIEVDGPGYGGSLAIEATVNNLLLPDGDFDVGVSHGSKLTFSNVIAAAPFYFYGGGDAVARFDNCVFGVGEFSEYSNRIVNPGNLTFSDCRFAIDTTHGTIQERVGVPSAPPGAPGPPRRWAAAHVFWWVSDQPQPARQSVSFEDCDFAVGAGVADADTAYAVYAESERSGDDAEGVLRVVGGRVGEGFDYGVFMNLGGRAVVRDVDVDAMTTLSLGSQPDYAFDVLVDGLNVGRAGRTYLELPGTQKESRLEHRGLVLDEERNVLSAAVGLADECYRGSRLVLGTVPPTPATHGLRGDLYRLKTPGAAGSVFEWVCAAGGAGDRAVWWPLTRVGD